MSDFISEPIFAPGKPVLAEYFQGQAFLTPLISRDHNNEYAVGVVAFEPGARTNWHTHPKGQNLLITEGLGFYQERGKAARPLKKGDLVIIPEHAEHWHGAAPASHFTHIAITNCKDKENVTWLQPVTDLEYEHVTR